MKQSLILILLLLSNYTFSQCNGRYQNSIFSNVDTIKDINYSDIFNDNFHKRFFNTSIKNSNDIFLLRKFLFKSVEK